MKIWVDITNSPHVNFFAAMLSELAKDHRLVVTCRALANTIDMLEAYGIPHTVVGSHYGKGLGAKAAGLLVRCSQLSAFLRHERVEVAISHSSFYSPVVSRLLGIRSIYLNDNEHALGNAVAFRFADVVMVPEFLDVARVERQGCSPAKLLRYPGVKEGVYLWNYRPPPARDVPPLDPAKKTVFVRPEPRTAQYYRGRENFLDEMIGSLQDECNVVVLPRDGTQRSHYERRFPRVRVPKAPLGLTEVREHCDLFVGAGGTMTREVSVLGVPTISVYQDELLDVDRFLIAEGAMLHVPRLTAGDVREALRSTRLRSASTVLLRKGRAAYELILRTLLHGRGVRRTAEEGRAC